MAKKMELGHGALRDHTIWSHFGLVYPFFWTIVVQSYCRGWFSTVTSTKMLIGVVELLYCKGSCK